MSAVLHILSTIKLLYSLADQNIILYAYFLVSHLVIQIWKMVWMQVLSGYNWVTCGVIWKIFQMHCVVINIQKTVSNLFLLLGLSARIICSWKAAEGEWQRWIWKQGVCPNSRYQISQINGSSAWWGIWFWWGEEYSYSIRIRKPVYWRFYPISFPHYLSWLWKHIAFIQLSWIV